MAKKDGVSRRQVVSGAAIAGVASALPAQGAAQGSAAGAAPIQDPRTKYPRPPFKKQSQPWPGLAGQMDPRPDHGETSYKGSGRLAGRKALITGGDSGMGRAAAIAYAREGADVAINYLPDEEADAREVIALIEQAGRKGYAIPGDLRDEAFCKKMVAKAVKSLGGLDILVNNAARQQTHASILDISSDQFDWTMKTNIYAPFWTIKAALPHLKPGSSIIGTTSEQAMDPSEDLYDYAQGGDDQLRAQPGQAARAQGHPRQRCGAGPDLDSAAGIGRRDDGETGAVRRRHPAHAARPAGGTGGHLCAAGGGEWELCHGAGLWRDGG
jgi:hypothetical protein